MLYRMCGVGYRLPDLKYIILRYLFQSYDHRQVTWIYDFHVTQLLSFFYFRWDLEKGFQNTKYDQQSSQFKDSANPTKKYQNPAFLKVGISLMVAKNPIIHSIF